MYGRELASCQLNIKPELNLTWSLQLCDVLWGEGIFFRSVINEMETLTGLILYQTGEKNVGKNQDCYTFVWVVPVEVAGAASPAQHWPCCSAIRACWHKGPARAAGLPELWGATGQDQPPAPVWRTASLHSRSLWDGVTRWKNALRPFCHHGMNVMLWGHQHSPICVLHLVTDFSDGDLKCGVVLEIGFQSKDKTFHVREELLWKQFLPALASVWVVGFSAADFVQSPSSAAFTTIPISLTSTVSSTIPSLLASVMMDTEMMAMGR